MNTLVVSPDFLGQEDRVVIVDDFLASGRTVLALAEIVAASGATLLGIGCVVEKAFEDGRARLASLGVPVVSLAVVERMDDGGIVVRSGAVRSGSR